MKWSNLLEATPGSYAIEQGFWTPWFRFLTNIVFDTCDKWALRDIADSQRIQRPGKTEAWSTTPFLQSKKNFVADARGSKSKVTGYGQAESPRASAGQRSYQCLPVVRQRKKPGDLRLCAEYKDHLNDKVIDEDNSLSDTQTVFHNLHGVKFFGKIDLSDAYNPIALDDEAKNVLNQHPEGAFQDVSTTSSLGEHFENCIEKALKRIKDVIIFQNDKIPNFGTKILQLNDLKSHDFEGTD